MNIHQEFIPTMATHNFKAYPIIWTSKIVNCAFTFIRAVSTHNNFLYQTSWPEIPHSQNTFLLSFSEIKFLPSFSEIWNERCYNTFYSTWDKTPHKMSATTKTSRRDRESFDDYISICGNNKRWINKISQESVKLRNQFIRNLRLKIKETETALF